MVIMAASTVGRMGFGDSGSGLKVRGSGFGVLRFKMCSGGPMACALVWLNVGLVSEVWWDIGPWSSGVVGEGLGV